MNLETKMKFVRAMAASPKPETFSYTARIGIRGSDLVIQVWQRNIPLICVSLCCRPSLNSARLDENSPAVELVLRAGVDECDCLSADTHSTVDVSPVLESHSIDVASQLWPSPAWQETHLPALPSVRCYHKFSADGAA